MTGLEIAIIAFVLMLLAIFVRVPIAIAMGLTGFFGMWAFLGKTAPTLGLLKTLGYDTFSSYSLSIVPLFLLMGQFATKSGMSAALFEAASDWLGHRKGGLAMAAIGGCAGFWLRSVDRRWRPPALWGRWPCPRCANAVIPMRYRPAFWRRAALWAS